MADSSERKVQTIQAQPAVTHEPVPAQPQGAASQGAEQGPMISDSLVRVGEHTDVRYLNEQEEARERLKASVDRLTEQASLQLQVQKEPLKMLGGASAVGAVVGLVLGRQLRRSKKVYVDAHSPVKHQREFVKAQKKAQQNNKTNVGGALVATLSTLAFKVLNDRVIKPKLEEMASNLLERAGQAPDGKPGPAGGQTTGRSADASRLPSPGKSPGPATSSSASSSAPTSAPTSRSSVQISSNSSGCSSSRSGQRPGAR